MNGELIKQLMIEHEKNNEIIREHENVIAHHKKIIESIEECQDKIFKQINDNFITFTFYDRSFSILNIKDDINSVKKLCKEKNIIYRYSPRSNYFFDDWKPEEYMKFIKQSNEIDKLLKYIENYIPEDDNGSDDE